tara:strand:- start:951 stop:1265 length:315 start_codon:yes stop_codon:yes gene_type:complete
MKLDITQLRKMILEEAQKMSPTGRKNLQEVFRSAGGIGFGDMKPLVQDAPQQPSLTPSRPRIIQNDSEHAVKELYEAAVHVAQLHGVDPRESLLLAAEEFPAKK